MNVQYGTEEFEKLIEEIGEAAAEGRPYCVVFSGGSDETRQEIVTRIADYTSLNANHRDAAKLVGDHKLQTQGLIREAFDTSGGGTLLVIGNADAIFAEGEREESEEDLDADAQTPRDYLFQRVNHRKGVTILGLSDPGHVERAAEAVADAVVEFPL